MTLNTLNRFRWLAAAILASLAFVIGVGYEAAPAEAGNVRLLVGCIALLALAATPIEQWLSLYSGEQRSR